MEAMRQFMERLPQMSQNRRMMDGRLIRFVRFILPFPFNMYGMRFERWLVCGLDFESLEPTISQSRSVREIE